MVPYLEQMYEKHRHRRLVEPFAGGLAVALGLMPERALLNDINPHLINFYLWLKRGLHPRLEMRYDRELYYAYRARFNQLISEGKAETQEAAELFYYLNAPATTAIAASTVRGSLTFLFGKYKAVTYTRDFTPYKKAFRNWEFTSLDLHQVDISPEDFVYADPPYDVEFTEYSPGGFLGRTR